MNGIGDIPQTRLESIGFASRAGLFLFSLTAGLGYRVIVGVFHPGPVQFAVLAAWAVIFLLAALLARQQKTLNKYWEIPFAFFIFTVAGIFGDASSVLSLQRIFVINVLHQAPTASNPIASTVLGTVLGQLVGTLGLVAPILLLTRAAGSDLKSIFFDRNRSTWILIVGIAGFLVFYAITASGRAQRLFPNNGVTLPHLLALTPALVVLVLCNGLREELWFRGLFLKKYGQIFGPLTSNILSAIIFTAFHVQVQYTPLLVPFLVITLIEGLILGYFMQKSSSLLAGVLFHAGSDIPIFLVYLASLQS